MCDFAENFRGVIEPEFCIGVSNVHDVVGHNQHLFNFTQMDDIISQSVQKFQPLCTENVVLEDRVLLS